MFITVQLRRLVCPFLTFVLITILASACSAIPMRVSVGFGGAAKSFVWTPVAVELSNPSGDNLEGTVGVAQSQGGGVILPTCSAKVILPAGSKKVYHAYIRLSEYGGALTVTFSRGGSLYALKKISINPSSVTDKIVVSIGGKSARLNFLNGETVPAARGRQPWQGQNPAMPVQDATIHPGSIAVDELADRPSAYEAADVVVVSDLMPSAADPKALKALSMWTASGGTLVIPVGANYRNFTNDFYSELLPVTLRGTANLAGMPSLSSLGNAPFPAGPVAVAQGTVRPGIGKVLAAEGGVPLVAERSYGAGKVIYLAFDHLGSPFRDWSGQIEFWKRVVRDSSANTLVSSTMSLVDQSNYAGGGSSFGVPSGSIAAVVTQNPSVQAPSLNTVGLFLVAYLVCLVPVNYFVLKKKRRLELAWLTTPAIVLVFAVAAYGIGYTMKGGSLQLNQASVVEGASDCRYARVLTDASMFSPARRNYEMELTDPYSLGEAIPTGERERIPDCYVGETSSIENIGMAMWSSKTFEATGGADLGGCIESRITVNGAKLSGTVKNNTDTDYVNCEVVIGGRHIVIGDLPRGVAADLGGQTASALPAVASSPSDSLHDRLRAFALTAASGSSSPTLVCEPAAPSGVFGLMARGTVKSATCCVFRLNYTIAGAFFIDSSRMRATVLKASAADISPKPGGRMQAYIYNSGGEVVVAYAMQVPANGQVSSLLVNVHPSSPGPMHNLEVSLFNRKTGQYDMLDMKTGRSANPAPYVSGSGEVQIRARHAGGPPKSFSLDLVVEGRAR